MDDLMLTLAARRGGFFYRGDLIEAGGTDAMLRLATRSRLITRLRHGTYAPFAAVETMTAEQRHVLTARSVAARLGDGVVLSHHSAALVHAPASWGIDLDTVHLTRLGRVHGREEAGVNFHVGALRDEDVMEVDGLLVTRPERAAFESAALSSPESALVTINAIAHAGTPIELIDDVAARLQRWPGGRAARLMVRLAEPRCESVGESRSLYVFWRGSVPRPEAQMHVIDHHGIEVARCDFGWRDLGWVGEFDGLIKYGRLNPHSGDELGQVLVEEKLREDRIRATGLGVLRWTWADLAPSARDRLTARVRESLGRRRSFPAA